MDTSRYILVEGMPQVQDYMRLRAESGLTPKTAAASEASIAGTWYGCHITLTNGEPVAMGRIFGDGGWYYVIADIATLPDHQRQGLASTTMHRLLHVLRSRADPGSFITLTADPPGVKLYEKFGLRIPTRLPGCPWFFDLHVTVDWVDP